MSWGQRDPANGQGSGQKDNRWDEERSERWVRQAFETAQSQGSPTGELNDGWDEWSSLAGLMPEDTNPGGGIAASEANSNGSAVSAWTPTPAPSSSQEALLGTDVDIITGQRYSAAQVINGQQHLLCATHTLPACFA